MRGIIIVAVTLTALIAMVVGVVGAGLHRIAADQKRADESWQRPAPTTAPAPATNPSESAIVASEQEPALPQRDSVDLESKDATRHGDIQLMNPPPRSGRISPELAANPRIAQKIRERELMRGNQSTAYLSGFRTIEDYAEWQVDVPKAGDYEIDLIYAIPKWQEGGNFSIRVGDKELSVRPESTRGDTSFRVLAVGKLTLGAGRTTLTVRPAPVSIKSQSFLNLRGVQLLATP